MAKQDLVVPVDESGHPLPDTDGQPRTMDKLQAHQEGTLHLAVSVFIFNSNHELMLQKRAADKYHTPDRWTNTCCTHPFPGEPPAETAQRRLKEEMGLSVPLTEAFTFHYCADVGELVEHEYDHVFIGFSDDGPTPDAAEVSDWKWIGQDELDIEVVERPETVTPWLGLVYAKAFQMAAKANPTQA